MASSPAGTKIEKLSFAKVRRLSTAPGSLDRTNADAPQIAAAGLKTSTAQSRQVVDKSIYVQKHAITSAPRDGVDPSTPSNGSNSVTLQAEPEKVVHMGAKSSKEPGMNRKAGTKGHVQSADAAAVQSSQDDPSAGGLHVPGVSEDANTQVSSSSSSAKPPSVDGKSIGSGTTFAMDEKESLRPDDSASAKATEDEDAFPPADAGLPGSCDGSEEDVRAFRDQLREISSMEPSRHGIPPHGFGVVESSAHGLLYVPPQGSGMGAVPSAVRPTDRVIREVNFPPDSKILEALESPRDRVWVLKLEQDISDFLKEPKEASLELPQCNSYHRMLAHRMADYCMLGHVVDEATSSVRLFKTPHSRLPPPLTGMTTPSTAASTPPPSAPQMKILRRGINAAPAIANGSGIPSKTASENGDFGNDDGKKAKQISYEERMAKYESVRQRIMGSAKPAESAEDVKEMLESRSSSATGKRSKKKRSGSDDGFDPRSTYNAYYTPPYSSNGVSQNSPGFPAFGDTAGQTAPQPHDFNAQPASIMYQPYASYGQMSTPWGAPGFLSSTDASRWQQSQQPGYDLSNHFQQAMNFQPQAVPTQHTGVSPTYDPNYQQQFYASSPGWPQQRYQTPQYPATNGWSGPASQQSRPTSSAGQYQGTSAQPYAYGQLPSETYPGRPPNKLEHPLPGSYKGKHFNPQSQTFVPGQPSGGGGGGGVRLFPLPSTAAAALPAWGAGSNYAVPSPQPRQASSETSPYGPSQDPPTAPPQQQQQQQPPAPAPHTAAQPLTHPLPQPVFPRQPSPSVPLPPKPGSSTPQKPSNNSNPPASVPQQQHMAPPMTGPTIAKWGTPASLPAKPPPPAVVSPAFGQRGGGVVYNSGAAATGGVRGMPSFGSMPPVAGSAGRS